MNGVVMSVDQRQVCKTTQQLAEGACAPVSPSHRSVRMCLPAHQLSRANGPHSVRSASYAAAISYSAVKRLKLVVVPKVVVATAWPAAVLVHLGNNGVAHVLNLLKLVLVVLGVCDREQVAHGQSRGKICKASERA